MDTQDRTLEIVIDEYKILWQCFHKSLDERKNIYEWYLKVVALPTTIISIFLKSGESKNVSSFLIGFYCVIFLAGISIFIAYTLEAASTAKFYKDINNIRQILVKEIKKEYRKLYCLDKEYSRKAHLFSVKFFKFLSVPILNSGIGLIALNSICVLEAYLNVLIYIFMIFMHVLIYKILFNAYEKGQHKSQEIKKQ